MKKVTKKLGLNKGTVSELNSLNLMGGEAPKQTYYKGCIWSIQVCSETSKSEPRALAPEDQPVFLNTRQPIAGSREC